MKEIDTIDLVKRLNAINVEKQQLEIKEQLIQYLVDALNDSRFCEDHILERKCPKKDLQCGDCLVKEFYDNLNKE